MKTHFYNIRDFLSLNGWSLEDEKKWYIYHLHLDGEDYEVVLPKNDSAIDSERYFDQAIEMISGISDDPELTTRERVKYVNTDVLKVKNLGSGLEQSITIEDASEQIKQLKTLIAYSATSEDKNRPHHNQTSSSAKRMIKHYRFGHTFKGSFGFSVESNIISKGQQLSLKDSESYYYMPPMERRVMERIARGLLDIEESARSSVIDILIEGYVAGLNANMCKAINGLSLSGKRDVEYNILWSPRVKVDDDLVMKDGIIVSHKHNSYIKEAIEELTRLDPEPVWISGHVVGTSSKDAPLISSTPRYAVIRWENRELNGKQAQPVDVLVTLDPDAYGKAQSANLEWKTVSVKGYIQRSGSRWLLSEPSSFKITD